MPRLTKKLSAAAGNGNEQQAEERVAARRSARGGRVCAGASPARAGEAARAPGRRAPLVDILHLLAHATMTVMTPHTSLAQSGIADVTAAAAAVSR